MIFDEIAKYGPSLWFAVTVVLFVLETVVPGVHFLWFGVAAAIVGALALAVPMAWQVQLILFSVVAIITVFLARRSGSGTNAKSQEPDLNVRGAQYIGRKVVVEEAIRNGRGRVRVGDTIWGAEGEDAPVGAEVEVTGVNGTVLVVATPDVE
ncbi:MAG TPA: NfeD family protein [Hyphomicrobium sp.]|nr:NfeD family protein [Hyphomicrobium sp.]